MAAEISKNPLVGRGESPVCGNNLFQAASEILGGTREEVEGENMNERVNLIFLDIDGVLNSHDFNIAAGSCPIERRCVEQLNRVIAATEAKFVLSSAWRYMLLDTEFGPAAMTIKGFEYLMRTHGTVGFSLLGTTCSDEECDWNPDDNQPVRGMQIRRWLRDHGRNHPLKRYVVVDDADLGITGESLPFVMTDGRVGLTAEVADQIIASLSGTPAGEGR